ncbi:MAG TPA: hypothetical protein VGQ37_24545 [Vicinamibacterales bacterium]|nr:hypothetical protein [Vicinamibacterales bacterium]
MIDLIFSGVKPGPMHVEFGGDADGAIEPRIIADGQPRHGQLSRGLELFEIVIEWMAT